MLDKVTRWVLCFPDNTTARSEGHMPFLPLQLSSNSRLIRIKQGEVCFLWPLCQNILMQYQLMKCTLLKLILSVFQFLTSSACFEPHGFILRKVQNIEDVKN